MCRVIVVLSLHSQTPFCAESEQACALDSAFSCGLRIFLPSLPSPPTHPVVVPEVGVHEQPPLLHLTAQVGQDLLHRGAQRVELLQGHVATAVEMIGWRQQT